MRMCHFRAQNGPFVLNNFFLVQTIIITFIYLLALFIVQNLKKFLQRIQSYEDVPFLDPKWPICPKQIFSWKLLISFSSTYYRLSLCKIKKKNFQQIQSYDDVQFFSPKWSISPNKNFFRKPINEPCFFHSCLSTCQKSNSDINLLVKYWWLKNTGISLAITSYWNQRHFLTITWELNFSLACSFCRTLMNHKSFHFAKIPDKTNDINFLKSPKTMFLGHFWSFFAWWGFFPKNQALSHTTIYGPLTLC